jgi:hypothetical protein
MMRIISSSKLSQYAKSKLGAEGLSHNQLIQATAEVLLTSFFFNLSYSSDLNLSINTDVRNNPSTKKDVDIQIRKEKLILNLEVKTPNQDIHEEGKFYGALPHRYPNAKRAEDNPLIMSFSEMLKIQSGKETQILKTNDNKIKDYIESANAKFSCRATEALNILSIMCTSKQMGEVLLYLLNPHTGLVTPNTYNKDIDYSKIDYIIVSNAVEGINGKSEYRFDVRDFSNYITLIISPHKDLSCKREVIQFLYSIVPNDNSKFAQFERDYTAELREGSIPDEIHYLFTWSGYLAKCRPEFAFSRSENV